MNDKVDAIHSKADTSKKDFVTQNIMMKDSFKMYPKMIEINKIHTLVRDTENSMKG